MLDGMTTGPLDFQSKSLSLAVVTEAEADRIYIALAEGGTIQIANRANILRQALWQRRRQIRHLVDDHCCERLIVSFDKGANRRGHVDVSRCCRVSGTVCPELVR